MFIYRKVLITLALSGLLEISAGQALGATIANTSCKTVGLTKKSPGKTYVCSKSKTNLIWALKKSVPTNKSAVALPDPVPSATTPSLKLTSLPTTAPESEIYWEGMTIKVAVVMPSKSVLESEGITQVQARLKFGSVPIPINGDLAKVFKETERVNFSWDLSKAWDSFKLAPWNIYVELEFVNAIGSGPVKIKDTVIPKIAPAPTPTPTPTPTPPPATPVDPTFCSPTYMDPLPYSSQRIAMTKMDWKKDLNGYVYTLVTLRNDLTVPLRLVQFDFSFINNFEVIDTENVLAGYHYYAKDDEKFNSYDKTPGAWLSGQSRTFKIDSNKILDCKNIYIFGSRFTVTMGIGDS